MRIDQREAIITIVGFLGAGKTTLLKDLTQSLSEQNWSPFIILNDYEYADLDVQQFSKQVQSSSIKALSGSCICCSGIHQLREIVNNAVPRKRGITLIEANGTTDACSLAGFLGVGINERYLPPIQISVVSVKDWQRRDDHNELEANQIQLSSLIVLMHLEGITKGREAEVRSSIKAINPLAKIVLKNELDVSTLPILQASKNEATTLNHLKAHWASSAVDLPLLANEESIYSICKEITPSILRIKGCAKVDGLDDMLYFERSPNRKITIKPYNGFSQIKPKLLTIGLGSNTNMLKKLVDKYALKPVS